MISQPKRKWAKKEKPADERYDGSEALLQGQMDDMLAALGIWFLRFPDGFFRWIKMNAPSGIQRFFFGVFGGIPDSLPMIKISDKYMLCCPIELKTAKGKRHGKQKHWEEKGIAVQISRSPEDNIAIVEQFQADANRIRCMLQEEVSL
jgi:hypothetical protein